MSFSASVGRDTAAFEDGPTLDGAVSWTRGPWPPSFNGPKPSSGSQRWQSNWSKRRMFLETLLPCSTKCKYIYIYTLNAVIDTVYKFTFVGRCNVYLVPSHTLTKVWGSREVDQNSVPTGVRNVAPRCISDERVETRVIPTQIQEIFGRNIKLFHERWNQLLQDNGRSHGLEGWTERTWKRSKDLLVAQDGFRTVGNWELHVYASCVLT